MADRGIIFSAQMVRALLAGTKTQTRRILKPQPQALPEGMLCKWHVPGKRVGYNMTDEQMHRLGAMFASYAPGDRLYVREAWGLGVSDHGDCPRYRATMDYQCGDKIKSEHEGPFRWRSPIHMPRWASRITLTVTEVRVIRLQEISEEDAIAEGVESLPDYWVREDAHIGGSNGDWIPNEPPVPAYHTLWNSLHGPDAWDQNPWVVAVTFTVRRGNIDEQEKTP